MAEKTGMTLAIQDPNQKYHYVVFLPGLPSSESSKRFDCFFLPVREDGPSKLSPQGTESHPAKH